jgi:hypothetical protein
LISNQIIVEENQQFIFCKTLHKYEIPQNKMWYIYFYVFLRIKENRIIKYNKQYKNQDFLLLYINVFIFILFIYTINKCGR